MCTQECSLCNKTLLMKLFQNESISNKYYHNTIKHLTIVNQVWQYPIKQLYNASSSWCSTNSKLTVKWIYYYTVRVVEGLAHRKILSFGLLCQIPYFYQIATHVQLISYWASIVSDIVVDTWLAFRFSCRSWSVAEVASSRSTTWHKHIQ